MATTLTPSHPQFTFLFLAVRRAELRALPHREAVIAPDEISARRLLARDYVLSFAGRLPVQGLAMFDSTPLTLDEIADQCRALTHAVIELDNPMAKEVLTFVLAERLELLAMTLQSPEAPETDSGVSA